MPLIKLQFKPGINRDQTNYSNEGGWFDCDKVRFRQGFPQKIGGWTKLTPDAFLGVCRQLWNWVTTFQDNFMALGTNKKVYIEAGSRLYNVTPFRASFESPDTDDCITTTNESDVISVSINNHGATTGDTLALSGVTGSVGGVPASELNGEHVITVVDFDTVTFTVATEATSSATGGGTGIEAGFEISPGNAIPTEGYGWGTDTWGNVPWGLGSTQPVFLPQRDWWFDNIDNDLIMNIRNGPAYYWERGASSNPETSLSERAIPLQDLPGASEVPTRVMQLLMSQNDRHLLAFGAVPFGETDVALFDPMLIRWSDQDRPEYWTPEVTNSAGFIRVSRGSRIIRALPTRQEILVWTDSHLYSLQFLGTTDVFSLQEYADNVSIVSSRACITVNNITFWMGNEKFYVYDGRVNTLPCTVRDYVFRDFNFDQAAQVVCGTNEEWNEIWWMYPSSETAGINDRYVVYNYAEKSWYYGTIDRTAWLDSGIRRYPHATNAELETETGFIYLQETSTDADGEPMQSYIQSSDFDLAEGGSFMLTKRILPDVSFARSETSNPELTMSVKPRNFPGSAYPTTTEDDTRVVKTTVDTFTPQVFVRARARQMALRLESDGAGVQWQLGAPRLDARQDGER